MGFVESFDMINGVRIMTTVTNELKKVDDILQSFLLPAPNDYDHKVKVIGLDSEWVLIQNPESKDYETKCATLHLCDGTLCLIIQLQHLDSIPNSLLTFLRLPDHTFVGVGIKDNLAKLEKHYGIGCKNAVELRPQWAAAIDNTPHWSISGAVDEIAHALGLSGSLDLPSNAVFNDWGQVNLSKEQAKLATAHVYCYYKIGCSLLQRARLSYVYS